MPNVKLIHINQFNQKETLIATFKNKNEAAMCRDLLQAKLSEQDVSQYSIDFKEKGINYRQSSETFAKQVLYMAESVKQNIRLFLA
jgi:hypothetical protein